MTEEQIKELFNRSLAEIAPMCRDPQFLLLVMALCHSAGKKEGMREIQQVTDHAFRHYSTTLIEN